MTHRPATRPPIAALAAVVLPPVLALVLAFAAGLAAERLQQDATRLQSQLTQARRTAPASPDQQAAQLLIGGETAGLAAAALQAMILNQVQVAGLQVQQIESKGAEPAGALTRLRALGTFQGTEAQIMEAVAAIEAAEPLLFIDRLQLEGNGQEAGLLRAEIAFSAYAGPVQP